MVRARCRGADPDLFSPQPWQDSEPARSICRRCPVRAECLSYALEHNLHGIWGGTSGNQRTKLKSRRERTFCPMCQSSLVIYERGGQLCVACGVSWMTPRKLKADALVEG